MKKKIFTIVLALCLVLSLSATAFAVDGTAADGPKDATTGNPSSGAATVTYDDVGGNGFQADGDDDDVAKDDETTLDGTNISVWGKVTTNPLHSDVYSLDVAWGAMKFQFDRSAARWDTANHQYVDTTGGSWTEVGYVDGTNNKITVTNHSNKKVSATFGFAIKYDVFNAEPTEGNPNPNVVTGNFFATNDNALTAARIVTEVANVQDPLTNITLESAAPTGDAETGTADIKNVFFAFSGTPDNNVADFTKAGTITITFNNVGA